MHTSFLILHDIRSVLNVGAMFRTADAAGISRVYCTGHTPLPVDRFGRLRNDFAKAALGSETFVQWQHEPDLNTLITRLKSAGVEIVALEQGKESIDYKQYVPRGDFALMVGSERFGMPADVSALADQMIEIPMKGRKESLNVATALGIALFRILNI